MNTTYKVSVHKSGGYRYASTQPTRLNPKTNKKECRHIHWGTLDENNKFYPNKKYIMASPEERAQLIFPADWDLSEIEHIPVDQITVVPVSVRRSRTLMQNAGYLVNEQDRVAPLGNINAHGVLHLIEKLEDEGLTSDKILEIIKYIEA